MNHSRQDLLSIGDFARLSHLTLKALRLYAQLGFLTPTYVDPDSGYRYYSPDLLHEARLVRTMRLMGMPLATIRQVLAAAETPALAEGLVRDYLREMEAQLEQARHTATELLAHLQQEILTMPFEVQVRTLEPQPVVSLSRRVKVDRLEAQINEDVKILNSFVEAHAGKASGSPFGLYHGPINEEDDGPIEICLPTANVMQGEGEIGAKELPGARAASVTLTGEQCRFPAVLQGYDAVYDWIEKNGYKPEGSPREIWHTLSGPDERLEVVWPFRER